MCVGYGRGVVRGKVVAVLVAVACITPALAATPIPAYEWRRKSWIANVSSNVMYAPFTAPWNLAGFPAAVVPAGMHPAGVPLSVQIVTPPGGEALLLSVARQIEMLRPWPRLAPLNGEV
jgi:amidase